MDKQKQIEEMAKYCCNVCEMSWGCDDGCCAEKGQDGYKNCGLAKETAEKLYNAGYRKIPENAVIVPDMAGKDFYTVEKSEWDKMVQGAKDIIRATRKETAEKFAEKVKEIKIRLDLSSAFQTYYIRDNDIMMTLRSKPDVIDLSNINYISWQTIINSQTFPQDYDFMPNKEGQTGYICGMSVPPIMIKRLVTRLIESGIFKKELDLGINKKLYL